MRRVTPARKRVALAAHLPQLRERVALLGVEPEPRDGAPERLRVQAHLSAYLLGIRGAPLVPGAVEAVIKVAFSFSPSCP